VHWYGSFTFEADSASDGTHPVSLVSLQDSFGEDFSSSMTAALLLTLADGRVTDVTGQLVSPIGSRYVFSGLTAFYEQPQFHHYGPTSATATLGVNAVPEPGTYALMVAGLAAVGALKAACRKKVLDTWWRRKFTKATPGVEPGHLSCVRWSRPSETANVDSALFFSSPPPQEGAVEHQFASWHSCMYELQVGVASE
jgi:hypothetical protein